MTHFFCFGYGYTASQLARNAQSNFAKISGTSRSQAEHANVEMYEYNKDLNIPKDVTHVLISIPPNEDGDIVYRDFSGQIKGLENLKWLGYISTTSVYGDRKGEWVDENVVVNPSTQSAKNRVAAENQWLKVWKEFNIPVHIFRFAGIYGDARNQLSQAIDGSLKIVEKKDQVFSRTHVDDIANLLLLSMQNPTPGEIYNVADDYPCNPSEVSKYCYQLLGKDIPNPIAFEDADLSVMARQFYSESKRVSNIKAKKMLSWQLKYPSYKKGLLDCFLNIKS